MNTSVFGQPLTSLETSVPVRRARMPDACIRESRASLDSRTPVSLTLVIWVAALVCAILPPRAAAQTSAVRVARCAPAQRIRSLNFSKSPEFTDLEMAAVIGTEAPPGAFRRSVMRADLPCIDTLMVRADAARLAVVHRLHGWYRATAVARLDRSPDGVNIFFDITKGPEARIDSLNLSGLPDSTVQRRSFDAPLRALMGQRYDRVELQLALRAVVDRLRDAGYARAAFPVASSAIDSAGVADTAWARVRINVAFATGPRLRIGEVHVAVQGIGMSPNRLDSGDIMGLVRLRAGQQFRATGILDAQRDLYRSDAFRLVLIDTVAPRRGSPDSVIDLRIAVAEARTRYARVGLGWATQDCVRAQLRVLDRGFLGPGRRVELSARASKIGQGAPLDFAPAVCSNAVRADPFSEKANYYVGTSVSDSRLFGYPLSPVLNVYSERRSEPFAYLRETAIGVLAELSTSLSRRTLVSSGLQYEDGRTTTDPVISCSRFSQCRPEDFANSRFGRAVGVVSSSIVHDRTNDAANPRYGSRFRGEARAGVTSSDSSSNIRFYRGTTEVSGFTPLLGGTVAARIQVARVTAPGAPLVGGSPLIPQQERLFAGGQNSVRGFQQNLLGPLVYVIVDTASVKTVERDSFPVFEIPQGTGNSRPVPRGGTAMLVGNLEWRRPVTWPTNKLQIALFIDAGTLWESRLQSFKWPDVRATPGFGVRLETPLGPFRVDLGYQPYEARLGRALLFTRGDKNSAGQIFCVSPDNQVSIDPDKPGSQTILECPDTYRPARGNSLLSRLVFHFSIGQAF